MYKNVENFKNWIMNTIKEENKAYANIDAYLEDLEQHYAMSGQASYELSSYETESGHPETYDYTVEHVELGDDETETIFNL